MKKCIYCHKEVEDNINYCPECGGQSFDPVVSKADCSETPNSPTDAPQRPYVSSFTQSSSKSHDDISAYPQPPQQSPSFQQSPPTEDKVNVGFAILSVLVPIAGIIIYFCQKKEKPRSAKACGVIGTIMIVINLIISIATFALSGSVINKSLDFAKDAASGNDSSYSESYDIDVSDDTNSDDASENTTSSSTTTASNTTIDNSSTFWTKGVVVHGSNEITLPVSYKDFSSKTGYTFKDSQDLSQTLKSNYYLNATLSNGKKSINVQLINNSKDVATLDKCDIVGVTISKYNGSNDFVFPGNLKIGDKSSNDTLKKTFGDVDYEYPPTDGNDYQSVSFKSTAKKTYMKNTYDITCSDGKISNISLTIWD